MKHLIFILYDGIQNSVFQGQVLQPLLDQLKSGTIEKVSLVSFEKKKPSEQFVKKTISKKKTLEIIFLKKIPFIGTISLWPAIIQLKSFLKKQKNYHLIARGPLAGFICQKADYKKKHSSLIIQARGLLAAEYEYTKKNTVNFIKKIIHILRTKQFFALEKTVYKQASQIEAVSPALKNYLIKTFNANPKNISIAKKDIPKLFEFHQVNIWKQAIRKELSIPTSAHVYCFNGSAKAWQCPTDVVTFFANQKSKNIFLLILTQDIKPFSNLLEKHKISSQNYAVLTVDHKKIYRYLAACDTGLIFRERHIVNWVSRPTKVLEYRAVGLKIKHNNTIQWLMR